jgi:hypothetical protein
MKRRSAASCSSLVCGNYYANARDGRGPSTAIRRGSSLVVPENRQQDDEWQRDANEPKQQSASESPDGSSSAALFIG